MSSAESANAEVFDRLTLRVRCIHMNCGSLQTFNNSSSSALSFDSIESLQTVSKLLTIRSAAELYSVNFGMDGLQESQQNRGRERIFSTRSRDAGIRGGIPILNVSQFKGHLNPDPILLPRMFLNSRDIRNEKSTRGCTNS
jgi:hypothetical protein